MERSQSMDCKSCRWFQAAPDDFSADGDMSDELVSDQKEYGFCHRHAPAPKEFDPQKNLEVQWPLVWESEWCGEWKRRQEASYGA
jgi:hypothetical protein